MMLDGLFKKRQTNYIKELMRYGRLIFNDHFVLILLLLFGAGGYVYSHYLETVALGALTPRVLVAFLYYLVVSTGSVNLLLEPADQIFLLPKEMAFKQIFKKRTAQSFLLSLFSVALVVVVTWPIFVATLNAPIRDLFFIFLTLASLKALNLFVKILSFFEQKKEPLLKARWGILALKLVLILALLFFNRVGPSLLVFVLAAGVGYFFFTDKWFSLPLFNWPAMIEAEGKRLQRVYRFIGLFATVPNIETNIKRLPWLDSVLDWLSARKPTAPYYYLLRTTARNSDYSMLVIRVTIVGALLLAVTGSWILSSLLLGLFLYMLGFQLISLVSEMERVPQFKIYPVSQAEKEEAVYQLIFQVLVFVTIILGLASSFQLGLTGLILLPVGFVFAYGFSHLYAPRRVEKLY